MILALALLQDWEPAKTWVFAVGVLEWKDSERYASFPKEGRRDAELIELFKKRGVPADQIVFLKDEEATRAAIEKSLAAWLAKTGKDDLLFLYYAGHGGRDDAGAAYFVPWDGEPWTVKSICAMKFPGRAWLTADCCYSGALAVEARGDVACLTSSSSSAVSTGNWTFTECLLAGLRGEAAVDLNADGAVLLAELAAYTEAEMAFAEEQLSTFSSKFALRLADAGKKAHPRIGERLDVLWKEAWYKARIDEAKDESFKVHYVGFGPEWDEWVGADRMREHKPAHRPKGATVEVDWNGTGYPAKVLDAKLGLHLIHYDGYPDFWDEWVASKRIRD